MCVNVRWMIAVLSLTAGSWVGLHPGAESVLTGLVRTPRVDTSSASVETGDGLPTELRPHVETALAPGLAPWPRLNPEASIKKAWRLAEGPHRQPGDRRKLVTLTFDDGPFPETTPRVLELLDEYGVRATFFVIGRYLDGDDERAQASRAVLQSIVDAGHLVGNHTHDHALLTSITRTQVLEQIDRGTASIERAIGKRPLLFRPPFGQLDEFGEEAVSARRLELLLWNIEAQDMERDDAQAMFQDIVRQLTYNEGGVVLLHDIRWSSVKILKKLLAYLDERRYDPARPEREGYAIVDLPTYLRAVEASPPQQGAREARSAVKKGRGGAKAREATRRVERAARDGSVRAEPSSRSSRAPSGNAERKETKALPATSSSSRRSRRVESGHPPPLKESHKRAVSPTNLPSRASAGQ